VPAGFAPMPVLDNTAFSYKNSKVLFAGLSRPLPFMPVFDTAFFNGA
jgi:hypothetical protein